ncbi:UDP-D-xylose:L-fucose alpha-1,3-D-xylosyltransferase 3 [Holothuria leucospilota]|uniref:UDP-D-xylose:L-fucose alpha-1,3-D-xylosyltransferase 3 n=1 Tax=Holothuria leucospilota TaxID=206669 RepID=A0A9Q1CM98_HOLLE|nr:UDP-D-xylose:L-fucose alpha-1,3-D-xylosyltransferase 3 [Holothuria leucospilota]
MGYQLHVIASRHKDGIKLKRLPMVQTERRKSAKDSNSYFPSIEDIKYTLSSPVLLICVNFGFLDFLANLLFSINRLGLKPNVLVVCEDEETFLELSQHGNFYDMKFQIVLTHLNKSLPKPSEWKSDGYIQLVRKRPHYIETLLKNNLDVFYVDTDIVWLGDPFPFFRGGYDLFIQQELQNETLYCAGFFYMKSNEYTRSFVSSWARTKFKGRRGIQRALNDLLKKFTNISISALPTNQFSSGGIFFSSNVPWYERSPPPIEVHVNFMAGHDNKKDRMKTFGLWFLQE